MNDVGYSDVLKEVNNLGIEGDVFWIRATAAGFDLKQKTLPTVESIQAAAVACIFPDLAFYNDVPLGVDGSFYPFGTTPMVYDKFYIGSQTAFSKKKSLVHINFDLAPLERLTDNPTVPQLSWEYWNGKGWTRL